MKKRILSLLLSIAMIVALFPAAMTVYAATSGKCGANITWTLDSNGTLTISGIGKMYDYSYGSSTNPSPFYALKNDIKNVVIGEQVTYIGNYMFSGCSNMLKVNIPECVTSIGKYAFSSCKNLTTITIPELVTNIGEFAFANCSNLSTINFNAKNCADFVEGSLSTTGGSRYSSSVFSDSCKNVTKVTVKIGDNVTRIPQYFIANVTTDMNVVIGRNVTEIGSCAFHSCDNLLNIDIPNKLKKVGYGAFYFNRWIKVRYNGTQSDWNLITIQSSGNEYLINASKTFYHIVDFIDKNGDIVSTSQCDLDAQFDQSWIPTKEENSAELYSDAEMTTEYDVNSTISQNTNIYVKYTANQYSYYFIDEDGTVLKEATVDYGAEIIPPENPSKESTAQYSYTFAGWDGFTEGMTQGAETLYFYASYTPSINKYTYKFVNEDGTVLKEQTVNYNTMITAPASPSKEATAQYTYAFSKWDGFTLGMKIKEDVTFTAVYDATVNQYTYKFVDEKGAVIEEKTADYGTTIVVPYVILTKDTTDKYTYTFSGWSGYEDEMILTENITFTPIFNSTINQYSYKFVDEDGTVLKEGTVDYDTVLVPPANPTKSATQQYTYTFAAWDGYYDGITQKAETMIFTAKYNATINQYTYKFLDEDGTTLKETTVDYGTLIVPPANPTKVSTDKFSYTFKKWSGYTEGMEVTENVTFVAEYTATINKYTYKFIDYDGSIVKSATVDYGTTITTPAAPEGYSDQQYTYVFASWSGYIKGMTITKDIQFTARYSKILNQYTYLFVDENGNTVFEDYADYGTEIVAPEAPVKPSTDKYTYVFAGWSGYTEGMQLTEDVIFTPTYTPVINQYTYKFIDDDGTVIEEKTVDYESVIIPPANPDKPTTQQYTYTFAGWDGYREGITQKAETMVFTAKYDATVNQYTYKFVDEDETVLKEATVDYGTVIIAPQNPTKKATVQYSYEFSGWNGFSENMLLTEDVVFVATYSQSTNQYTYQFVDVDGTIVKSEKVDFGETIILPETPADKDPYTFDYWNGFTDGMTVGGDISFDAVYKFKQYDIEIDELERKVTVTYGDNFTLPIQEIKDFNFIGYYTQTNGNGTKITDENGNSIIPYEFATNIMVYPYYIHSFANKMTINGNDEVAIGSTSLVQSVSFATDKEAKYLTCTVKYPEKFELIDVAEKDFALANINSTESKDGYTYAKLTCMYDYSGSLIPTNQTVTPFELIFNVSKEAKIGKNVIEINEIVLKGTSNYNIETGATKEIQVLPKLAESINISGSESIDAPSKYVATVSPDYTSNKNVIWSVDNEDVAKISADGILTPLKNGAVTITATADDGSGIASSMTVEVTAYATIKELLIEAVWDVEFSENTYEYTLYIKEDATTVNVNVNYENGALFANGNLLLPGFENTLALTGETTVFVFDRTNVADMTDSKYTITIVKFEGTKTEVSDDKKSFTITPINIESGKTVILALYNDEQFVEMQSAVYAGEAIPFKTTKSYTNAKVMVWDDLTTLRPVCKVEIIK